MLDINAVFPCASTVDYRGAHPHMLPLEKHVYVWADHRAGSCH